MSGSAGLRPVARLTSTVTTHSTTPMADQNAGNPVLDGIAAGPWTGQEGATQRAQDRQDRRRTEVLVIDPIATQDQDRDVDHGEDAQQQQGGGAAERRDLADECDQTECQQRRETDRDVGRPARRVDLAEHRGRTRSRLMP